MWKIPALRMIPAALMMVSPAPAFALCCIGDANVIKAERSGLGQSQPLSSSLSLDPQWRVHIFERDSISYYQVSDAQGELQFIIGKSGTVFWTLPAGVAEARINLPPSRPASDYMVNAREVYRDPEFVLLVSGTGSTLTWRVEYRPALP